ncbi:MAG: thioredoxin domain-containing protein [Candidatus Micrarchaeia archaeon]
MAGTMLLAVSIVIAALIVASVIYISSGSIVEAIGKVNITTTAAPAAANQGAAGNQGTGGQDTGTQAQAPTGDWSFVNSDPAIGPKDAKVTVIEFADFQCPYCGIVFGRDLGGSQYDSIRGTATKMANDYAKTGKIRFVYHTMAFLGQESIDAANAAFCARAIGGDEAFFTMHDKLFSEQQGENQGDFTAANLKKYAAEAGFNTTEMMDCIDKGTYDSLVTQSNSEANAAGVQGTPTFAVNNQILSNGAVYSSLKSYVDNLLAQ